LRIKSPPFNNQLILHVLDISWLERDPNVEECLLRVEKLPKLLAGLNHKNSSQKDIILDIVTAEFRTIAVSGPSDLSSSLASLRSATGCPNPQSVWMSESDLHQVRKENPWRKMKIMLNGARCAIGLESAILDRTCSTSRIPSSGAITAHTVSKVLEEDVIDSNV
jgi:tRNA A37 threonylcarbamoyladenosine synthetase subunit TsaC/SUA5/YrdC